MPLIPRIRKQTIALIDSANLAFRFAHSFKGMMIKTTATSQVSSGIIYGMLDTIWKLRELHKIDIAIFVLEGSHENNPRRKHPIYKSKRPTSISVDITAEMNLIKELAPLLGIPVAIPTTGEADDGIAFFTNKFCSSKYENLICSADHDMQVLLNKNTKIIKSANKKEQGNTTRTENDFWAEYGFAPRHFSLFMAVTGDSSDSIPGIRGIGPKKGMVVFRELTSLATNITPARIAKELIKTYPNIIDGASQEYLEALINEYWFLTKIRNNWPITVLPSLRPDVHEMESIFNTMKFRNFLNNLEDIYKTCNIFHNTFSKLDM